MVDCIAPEIIVFDFDGTLVDSNPCKRQAFYSLFPDTPLYKSTVTEILDEEPEASRYVIVSRILQKLELIQGSQFDSACADRLTAEYGNLVLQAVSECPEKPGASDVLSTLARRHRLYLSSGTPIGPLVQLVSGRGWSNYFKGIFGYPEQKAKTLRRISLDEDVGTESILVVGDGESDRAAAVHVGCSFFPIREQHDLHRLAQSLGC